MLLRQQPAQTSTARDVARALYISERAANELLHAQCTAGILERKGAAYRYAPRDAALAQALDRLAEIYAIHLIAVTHLIHDATQKSAQRFADAFKLR